MSGKELAVRCFDSFLIRLCEVRRLLRAVSTVWNDFFGDRLPDLLERSGSMHDQGCCVRRVAVGRPQRRPVHGRRMALQAAGQQRRDVEPAAQANRSLTLLDSRDKRGRMRSRDFREISSAVAGSARDAHPRHLPAFVQSPRLRHHVLEWRCRCRGSTDLQQPGIIGCGHRSAAQRAEAARSSGLE
jgi:hypothetical protein